MAVYRLPQYQDARYGLPPIQRETGIQSARGLNAQGVTLETSEFAPIYDAGSIINTSAGQWIRIRTYVATPDGLREDLLEAIDIGGAEPSVVRDAFRNEPAPSRGLLGQIVGGGELGPAREGGVEPDSVPTESVSDVSLGDTNSQETDQIDDAATVDAGQTGEGDVVSVGDANLVFDGVGFVDLGQI